MKIFSTELCELAEAPLWHSYRNSLFWLDIINRKLYEKNISAQAEDPAMIWALPEHASTIATDRHQDNIIWMVTEKSFGYINLDTGCYKAIVQLDLKTRQRANDGVVSPTGEFYFGSMAWEPHCCDGGIYSITAAGNLIRHGVPLGIPNTFCWNSDGTQILISDSLENKLFSFKLMNGKIDGNSKTLVIDTSIDNSTPDGGAMDTDGCLWIAHWNGSKVVKYHENGNKLAEITLPVPKPTSCCFGGINNQQLFITTARTDMTSEVLKKHPLSGQVFVVNMDVEGAPVFPYSLDY